MSSLDAIRRPEHIGDQRCWPCTVVNVAIVCAVALVLGRRRRALGLAVASLGATLVYLRGYVVPGTPAFAPKLVAASPLPDDWFHTDSPAPGIEREGGESGDEGLAGDDDLDGEQLLETLLAAGALTVDGETVDLDPAFAEVWESKMADLADLDTEALADATFAVAHASEASTYDGDGDPHEWVVLSDGSGSFEGRTWLSRPVAIAETAAVNALDGYVDDEGTRRAAAGPLRMFLQTCPDCGTDLREQSAASCCGGYTGPKEEPATVLACPDCNLRLYTFDD